MISPAYTTQPVPQLESEATAVTYFNLSNAIGRDLLPYEVLPLEADRTFVIYTTVVILTIHANVPMGIMNRTSWQPQANPPKPLLLLDRSEWDRNQLVPWTGADPAWVDVVVNNVDEYGHSFHLVPSTS